MASSRRVAYLRPTGLVPRPSFPIPPRLQPLVTPPTDFSAPTTLPSRGAWLDCWTRSTHILPAAWPRQPTRLQPNEKLTVDELYQRQRDDRDGRRTELQPTLLWTVAERYLRCSSSSDSAPITLICTHANGVHRETWDTVLERLLTGPLPGGHLVNEVWTLDAVTQGDGALINAENLPDLFHWEDNARDIVNFIAAYLPTHPSQNVLPSFLPRIAAEDIASRLTNGLTGRTIVGMGHSMGGAAMAMAAADYPALLSSLVLVDPVIVAPGFPSSPRRVLAVGALKRRNEWPSRAEALTIMQKSPFFSRWHPQVLQDYIDYGMYEQDGVVQLKCPPYQEASAFIADREEAYAWTRLGALPRRVEVFFILPGENNSTTGGDEGTAHLAFRPPTASHTIIQNSGHLIAQERPIELADKLGEFLERKYSTPSAKM